MPVPLFLKQCYTVWVGICVAYIFTHIPEWTSWVLLVIMALYDLAAVLLPGGPLKVCCVCIQQYAQRFHQC
jgi:presenilin 1